MMELGLRDFWQIIKEFPSFVFSTFIGIVYAALTSRETFLVWLTALPVGLITQSALIGVSAAFILFVIFFMITDYVNTLNNTLSRVIDKGLNE